MSKRSTFSKVSLWILLGMLAVLATVKFFFIGYYKIPQNGMYPALPAGSYLFTLKRAYSDPADVNRGDIVVFTREEKGRRYVYIWRVVGLPGEKVETSGESLVIDGRGVHREWVRDAGGTTVFREQIGDASYEVAFERSPRTRPPDGSVVIPDGQFFVMGDNRYGARDSRYFGPISFGSIIGKKL